MVKRIIFDLDNTLIMWKDEYINALRDTIKSHGKCLDANYVNDVIDAYEKKFDFYDKKLFLDFINEHIDDKIDMSFIDEFLYRIGFMSDRDEEVIDVLEYLSGKYDLVVLTNWFTIPQAERLKHAGIDKYFKCVFGAEKCRKPFSQSFMMACGDFKPSECLMIGDNYDIDIVGANKAGLDVLYFNYKSKENKDKFREFKSFIDLKDML